MRSDGGWWAKILSLGGGKLNAEIGGWGLLDPATIGRSDRCWGRGMEGTAEGSSGTDGRQRHTPCGHSAPTERVRKTV